MQHAFHHRFLEICRFLRQLVLGKSTSLLTLPLHVRQYTLRLP